MYLFLCFLSGIAGGVLAGLGMGGGTLTIPLLTLGLSVSQITAQFVNLASFIPSGAVALSVHVKNKLVDFSVLPWILLPSVIGCASTSFFATQVPAQGLKKAFGAFLVALALLNFVIKLAEKSKKGYLH